jgi:hypothetical protein
MNLTRPNTLLLVGIIILLVWGLFFGPQPRPSGRFQVLPSPDGPHVVMDIHVINYFNILFI